MFRPMRRTTESFRGVESGDDDQARGDNLPYQFTFDDTSTGFCSTVLAAFIDL
jgi:hypothetical protein